MVLYPKTGKPWMFGLHQCSYARIWTPNEKKLFLEIGRRLSDGLTSLLIKRELQVSEQKYHELFERSFDGVYITSPEGKILDANKKMLEIFGYGSKGEELNLDLARDVYVNPADRERVLKKINEEGSGEFDIPVKKKSGDIIIVHFSLIAARDDNGNITSYWGLARDVTAQKKAEENMERQLAEIRHLQSSMKDREKQIQDLKQEIQRLSDN
jgi:PAS domain S-box-containing protein